MRYRLRYNVGPLFVDRPFGADGGLLASLVSLVWYVVAFILQLAVWVVLLAVGVVYTAIWLIVWPFHRLLA